ncbi:type II toxin-antitoxin system PemK/MazF family toxin [Nodosilinea sp. LEGE 07088]|uniref:type II toxin-antitoxin system PemK/MazF family toxin n=1 Tax=Nodosilinea sp. LEGE 07088 TaxID=2777968 RepID=UPI001881909C|nr:type II toxin-antitoxin system PemK/MazF family toxin [Nodosilinea sp. LEGE 07088]MBE9141080.1 type II toxin-antitoxin system PemK/MazF family toxin [Nodosilinea sp. LEGE 07088]
MALSQSLFINDQIVALLQRALDLEAQRQNQTKILQEIHLTTKGRRYPTRVACQFQGKTGQIVLDQIRTVDKTRLVKPLGQISPDEQTLVLETLAEMVAE